MIWSSGLKAARGKKSESCRLKGLIQVLFSAGAILNGNRQSKAMDVAHRSEFQITGICSFCSFHLARPPWLPVLLPQVTGHERLLDSNPTLRKLINMRNPYIDPINILQVRTVAGSAGNVWAET